MSRPQDKEVEELWIVVLVSMLQSRKYSKQDIIDWLQTQTLAGVIK